MRRQVLKILQVDLDGHIQKLDIYIRGLIFSTILKVKGNDLTVWENTLFALLLLPTIYGYSTLHQALY